MLIMLGMLIDLVIFHFSQIKFCMGCKIFWRYGLWTLWQSIRLFLRNYCSPDTGWDDHPWYVNQSGEVNHGSNGGTHSYSNHIYPLSVHGLG